jgi:hypothetical protein
VVVEDHLEPPDVSADEGQEVRVPVERGPAGRRADGSGESVQFWRTLVVATGTLTATVLFFLWYLPGYQGGFGEDGAFAAAGALAGAGICSAASWGRGRFFGGCGVIAFGGVVALAIGVAVEGETLRGEMPPSLAQVATIILGAPSILVFAGGGYVLARLFRRMRAR